MPAVDGSVPDAGDVLWIDFGPAAGHEQAGRRPALVLSPRSYNETSSSLIVCPITRQPRPWPFKVALPPIGRLTGFVLVDQIKSIDPRPRAFRSAGAVPPETLAEVHGRLMALLGIAVGRRGERRRRGA